jgi:hypothetical protein
VSKDEIPILNCNEVICKLLLYELDIITSLLEVILVDIDAIGVSSIIGPVLNDVLIVIAGDTLLVVSCNKLLKDVAGIIQE